jgi:hypothetical protein
MRQLKFIAPTLMPTKGRPCTTLRNGDKWADLEQHEEVEIWVCSQPHYGDCAEKFTPDHPACDALAGGGGLPDPCKMLGIATITLPPWCGTFLDVPARLLDRHHCGPMSYVEAKEGMEGIYGDNFGVYGKVTVIDFMLK